MDARACGGHRSGTGTGVKRDDGPATRLAVRHAAHSFKDIKKN